jgi:hypothetical protein
MGMPGKHPPERMYWLGTNGIRPYQELVMGQSGSHMVTVGTGWVWD